MNLLNDFFRIGNIRSAEGKVIVPVELNRGHEIFKGHFPGNPVVPGVCMVQMLKEILREIHHLDFSMREASQLKFLAILNPEEVQALNVEFTIQKKDTGEMIVAGTFQREELIFLKFKATFVTA